MASEFENLTEAQRRTAEELRLLTGALRQSAASEARGLFELGRTQRGADEAIAVTDGRSVRELQAETLRAVSSTAAGSDLATNGNAAGRRSLESELRAAAQATLEISGTPTPPATAANLAATVTNLAAGGGGDVAGRRSLERELRAAAQATRELGGTLARNTGAVEQNTSTFADNLRGLLSGLSGGVAGGGGIGSFLRSGLGLAPLGLAIAGLFRGGDEEEPPAFERFELPAPIEVRATNSDTLTQRVSSGVSARTEAVATPAAAPPTQVVVNVSAMDSQSFMDRSADIARAVREAMLNMHPLNDVIDEL